MKCVCKIHHAQYTCDHLWENIKSVHEYSSSEPEDICKAIMTGFVQTHDGMCKVLYNQRFFPVKDKDEWQYVCDVLFCDCFMRTKGDFSCTRVKRNIRKIR